VQEAMKFSNTMEQTLKQNKTFIRNHFEEIVNRKNFDIAYQNFAPTFIDHEEPFVGLASPELVKQTMEKAYVRYPDLHVTVEDAIAEGDKVMVRCLWRRTDPSTGQKMEVKGFVIWRLADGKLAEPWATITPPIR
jgi:predicted SnoaL-like aldol condensation-catalyzing enzyme